jgi:hypothetical protein
MTETDILKTTRRFRRLRWQFKQDLALEKLSRADRVLIDTAALLALRAQQMRDDILTGDKPVSDEDLVRSSNCCIRAMAAIDKRKYRDAGETGDSWMELQRQAAEINAGKTDNDEDDAA